MDIAIMYRYAPSIVFVHVQVSACHYALERRHLHEATISATTRRVDNDVDRRMVADTVERSLELSGGGTVTCPAGAVFQTFFNFQTTLTEIIVLEMT